MNRAPAGWIAALAALALFALVGSQTWSALRTAGAWRAKRPAAQVVADDPYVMLDQQLARAPRPLPQSVRDPFRYGAAQSAVTPSVTPAHPRPVVPPPPSRPVLTAIVWDNDPRAIVNWNGKAWTIHEGLLFDEFFVTSIRPEQVVLRRGDETIVLTRKKPGE